MEYRKLPHGEEQISVIGLGNSSLTSQVGEKEIQATVEMALESGVNYFDMAKSSALSPGSWKPFRQITSTLALSTVWTSWPTWKKPSAAARWTTSNL